MQDNMDLPVGGSQRHNLDTRTTTETVVPVIAEELVVEKQSVPSGGVRVRKIVQEHDETIDLSLFKEHVDVRRVIIDRDVDRPQPIRREGDTVIVPVVEEVLVVQKRLRLKEELHITRHGSEDRTQQKVTLHREHAIVERLNADGSVMAEVPATGTSSPLVPERKIRPLRRNRVLPNE